LVFSKNQSRIYTWEDVEASKNAKHGQDTDWETWISEKSTGISDFGEVSPHPLLIITITPPVRETAPANGIHRNSIQR